MAIAAVVETHPERPEVLVIDDDYLVRLSAADELRLLGFNVIAARDADEALRVLGARHVDAVFSDLAMPGSMDGIGLAKWVLEHKPAVRVIVTPGNPYLPEELIGLVPLIDKPYTYTDVAARLRELLGDKWNALARSS